MAAMKRSAESQLTREQPEDDDVMDVAPSEGFKKADDTTLASRPMKGLPKRGNAVAATYDASDSQKNQDRGAGFAIPSSSFTFSTPSRTPTPTAAQPSSTNSQFKFSSTAVSPSATSASRTLSSLLNTTPQTNGVHTSESRAKPLTAIEDAEAKYFASLRGLNVAFQAQISQWLEEDPFCDLTPAIDMYNDFRTDVQKEFDETRKSHARTLTNGASSASLSSSKSPSSSPKASSLPSLPVPPKSFAGFGTPSSASTPSTSDTPTPVVGGFKPNFGKISSSSTTPSPFSFPSSSTAAEKSAPNPSPFSFGSSSSDTKPSPFGTSAAFSKASPFGGASTSSTFGSSSTTTDRQSNPFGSSSAFGSASAFGKSDASADGTSSSSNIFGGSSAGSSSSSTAFGGAMPSSSAFGSFGKSSSGSFGNPPGLSFGSKAPASTPQDSNENESAGHSANGSIASSSKAAVNFGSSSASTESFLGSGSGSASDSHDAVGTSAKPSVPASVTSVVDSRSSTPLSAEGGEAPTGESSAPKLLGENPNDLEGEGEENEETVHTARAKIYRFGKRDDMPSWNEVGVGMLRLKRHKETGALRLLSRNSGNAKIMLNFKLYPGFKVTHAKLVLNFIGHDNGANVTFRVRMKDEATAGAFHEAIEKAVSSLDEA